jgi:hypothetical protein
MKPTNAERGLGWLALTWCGAWCADLVAAWRFAPYDRLGVVAALAWLAALVVAARTSSRLARGWLVAGGLLSFVGVAGELNVAQHGAFALVAGAVAGGGSRAWWLLLLAPGWMPVLGWALRSAGPEVVNGLRVLAGVAAAGLAWHWSRAR